VIRHLVELFDLLDMRSHNGFLLFKDTDCSIDFDIHQALIIEVFEGYGNFILAFLVKNDFESPRVVIDLEKCPHRLLCLCNYASNYNNFVNCITIDFTDIIRPWRCFLDHLESDWSKYSVFAALVPEVSTCAILGAATCFIQEVASRATKV